MQNLHKAPKINILFTRTFLRWHMQVEESFIFFIHVRLLNFLQNDSVHKIFNV